MIVREKVRPDRRGIHFVRILKYVLPLGLHFKFFRSPLDNTLFSNGLRIDPDGSIRDIVDTFRQGSFHF